VVTAAVPPEFQYFVDLVVRHVELEWVISAGAGSGEMSSGWQRPW
jgi:hypothetical protein